MYFLENWHKFVLFAIVVAVYSVGSSLFLQQTEETKTKLAVSQLNEDAGQATKDLRKEHLLSTNIYAIGWLGVALVGFLIFKDDVKKGLEAMKKSLAAMGLMLLCFSAIGCYRPFEPVKLEVISANEEAFLLPFLGDGKDQSSSTNEEYLKQNLVYTKQVRIPQQWVPTGYEFFFPNGKWQDAAILIKVDKSPVTREWTADPNSGTTNKNEAVWVMTSDQVEFSTGWTITARIASRDDAIKFLFNYPNGSLEKVLDTEVRSKLQATFGLEVTDLSMETLRHGATPHLTNTIDSVESFFKERGITITNLGITGGFIYKDPTIMETLVRVFNAEQKKAEAIALNSAQEEINKKDFSIKENEAKGIREIAEAKAFEIEKANEHLEQYIKLKELEIQREMLEKWDGAFPKNYMSSGENPMMLLQLPSSSGE